MTITHPYGYPFAIFMICGALFFLAGAWAHIDDIVERRRHLNDITEAARHLEAVRDDIRNGRIPGSAADHAYVPTQRHTSRWAPSTKSAAKDAAHS